MRWLVSLPVEQSPCAKIQKRPSGFLEGTGKWGISLKDDSDDAQNELWTMP